jgi:hypothetical protein
MAGIHEPQGAQPPGGAPPSTGDDAGGRRSRASGVAPLVLGGLAVVVLTAAGAFTAYWFFAMASLAEQVAGWIEQRQTEGYRIVHGAAEQSGFPDRLRLALPDGAIEARSGWRWASPRTVVETRLFSPRDVTVAFEGDQRLQLPAAAGGLALIARAEPLLAVPRRGGWLPTGLLTATNLVVGVPGSAGAAEVGEVLVSAAGDPARPVTGPEEGTYDLSVSLAPLRLQAANLPLGDRVDRISMEARLMGALPAGPWPEALARWRDAGGTVEVTRLAVDYGPLKLIGDGTFALDRQGEVIAAMSVTTRDLGGALDALVARGVLAPEVADAARFVLRPPDGDAGGRDDGDAKGGPILRVPISIQNRVLFLGPLPVARVPALPWTLPGP